LFSPLVPLFFDFQHTPETLDLIFCTLIFSFSEIGVRSAFHRVIVFFDHTKTLQVLKFGFWDENLLLHPKLNAQRGSASRQLPYLEPLATVP
jgi:hypothetical protein